MSRITRLRWSASVVCLGLVLVVGCGGEAPESGSAGSEETARADGAANDAVTNDAATNDAGPEVMRTAKSDPVGYAKALANSDYVRTPNGLMHRDCVVEVPSGTLMKESDLAIYPDGSEHRIGTCEHPSFFNERPALARSPGLSPLSAPQAPSESNPGLEVPATSINGWAASSWYTSPTWLRELAENWSVPANPRQNGAIVFFFPSFETNGSIIQPVLDWGNFGNHWSISSWYVWAYNAKSVHSTPIQVAAGDSLWGSLLASNCQSDGTHCSWAIRIRDRRLAKESRIDIVSYERYLWAQGGVLEVQNVSSCARMPSSGQVLFNGLVIRNSANAVITPNFTTNHNALCDNGISFSPTSTKIVWTTN